MAKDKKETNGPTDDQINEVVDAIEREAVKLVSEKMEYMRRCLPILATPSKPMCGGALVAMRGRTTRSRSGSISFSAAAGNNARIR